MQEDSRAGADSKFFLHFCPIMRHCVVHKYNAPTDWLHALLDGLVRSDVSLQSNCKKADPLYDGDLPEFFIIIIGCVQNGLS